MNVIETSGLSKSFGNIRSVIDLSLAVPAGSIYGFLGPNGAGKSTTIRMLLGLVKPETGTISILGNSVNRLRNQALNEVGAFIEDPDFYANLSARTNLEILGRLNGGISAERIAQVLTTVGLTARADDRVKAYSRGMRQRLGIAQAILGQPRVLILDEPTSTLDPAGIRDMRHLILRLAREEQMTVFLSSHILHEVEQMCTHVAVIDQGRLIRAGTVAELLGESGKIIFEIRVRPLEKALSIISAELDTRPTDVSGDSIKVAASREAIPGVVRRLTAARVAVLAVIPRTSLEDYFLALTEGLTE